ncbi:Uncharacterized protein BM_BM3993, partial [Brugia malayi]|uniref:BMA-SULP-3 n=1 Tax=Brugia malayi TaxID=6279 RepID=A0A0K0JCQ3_BRUMA
NNDIFDYFNNTLSMDFINGTNSNFPFSKSSADLDNLKPIHVATSIMFISAFFFLLIIMGILRLEFLTCYFWEQVVSGFVVGGCIHVFFALLIYDLLEHSSEIHLPTIAFSISAIIFLFFGKEILAPRLSDVFLFLLSYELMLVTIIATNFAEISERYEVNVVGDIPTISNAILPRFDFISTIFFDSLIIAAISVAVHITVAKSVERRYNYKICYRQELYALGLSSMLSSFFPVYPVTSGFASSIIGAAVGGSTQLTTLFPILTLLSVILYIGPALVHLPRCVLASMLLATMKAYFVKFQELKNLWPVFKFDFLIWLMSMMFTICFDVSEGLALAVAFAVFVINGKPSWHLLARNDDGNCCEMESKQLNSINSNICTFRFNAPLIFTSTNPFVTVQFISSLFLIIIILISFKFEKKEEKKTAIIV